MSADAEMTLSAMRLRYIGRERLSKSASNAQAQRSAAWMPDNEGTLSFRLGPSLVSEATAASALQLVVRRQFAWSSAETFRELAPFEIASRGQTPSTTRSRLAAVAMKAGLADS